MNRNPLPDNISIEQQAEFWFGHIEAGDASQQEVAQFKAWLAQAYHHQDAFKQTAVLCQEVDGLSHLKHGYMGQREETQKEEAQRKEAKKPGNVRPLSWRSPKIALSAAAALVVAVAGLFIFNDKAPTAKPESRHYVTAVAESREFTLEDGSTITLGAKSQVTATFTENRRQVRMPAGEVYFDIASDSGRPFVIQVGNAEVEVVGTEFNINSSANALSVSVAEGEVAVRTPSAATASIVQNALKAGQQLSIFDNDQIAISDIDTSKVASWRAGHLSYRNTPLSQLVADISRHKNKKVTIASKELEELTVTATFGTGQIDQMLNGLPHLLPVQVIDLPGFILISAAELPQQ